MTKTQKELKKLLSISDNELEKRVINDLLDEEDAEQYIKDLLQYGCQSGMVSGLIYYNDTKKFYIEHMEDIEEILQDLQEQGCEPFAGVKYPLYNWLAWLGYEETARKVADKLNLEY